MAWGHLNDLDIDITGEKITCATYDEGKIFLKLGSTEFTISANNNHLHIKGEFRKKIEVDI